MADKWYDHLKPGNGAEAGCYAIVVYVSLGGLWIYLNPSFDIAIVSLSIVWLTWLYWLASTTVWRRYKRLENISLPNYKLHLVALMLMLSGMVGLLLIWGINYLVSLLAIPVIAFIWSWVFLVGLLWFLIRIEQLTDFFLRYVSKQE